MSADDILYEPISPTFADYQKKFAEIWQDFIKNLRGLTAEEIFEILERNVFHEYR